MYTIYIDESGEEGFERVRTAETSGSSPWFTLGAYIIKDSDKDLAEETLKRCRDYISRPDIHMKNMDHKQKVYVCKQIAQLPITLFGSISNKNTLKEYKDLIDGQPWKYYNKNVKYLLEKVGKYLGEKSIDEHEIIFEEKRSVRYDKIKNYIGVIKRTPLTPIAKNLRHIDQYSIEAKPKAEDTLLEIADVVAHALFQCCENDKYTITENRYLRELKGLFYCCPEGKVLHYGIKPINSVMDLELYDEDVQFLKDLTTKK